MSIASVGNATFPAVTASSLGNKERVDEDNRIMARYFELVDDRQSLSRWHLSAPVDAQGQEIDPWQFKQGTRIPPKNGFRLPLDIPGDPLDYCWAAFSIPIVHTRVVQLFTRLNVRDVQFLPAEIDGHEGPYFILNVLRVIDCIDDVRSRRVERWKPEDDRPDKLGQYKVVSGMRIDPAKIGEARVFRPWGWRVSLIVSEALKQGMDAACITGTRFIEV